jgi:hypothetical protein
MSWTKQAETFGGDPDTLPGMAQQLRLIADALDAGNPSPADLDGIINELDKIGAVLSNY